MLFVVIRTYSTVIIIQSNEVHVAWSVVSLCVCATNRVHNTTSMKIASLSYRIC